jgi:CBS domain-containing protein
MKIAELMTPDPECCTPEDSVVEAARIMERMDVGIVPVIESRDTRKAFGCVTDRDIVTRVVAQGKDPNVVVSLRQVMTPQIVTCSPNDDVETVAQLMREHRVRRVLVVDEHGALVGIVATADLARHLEGGEIAATLHDICQPA